MIYTYFVTGAGLVKIGRAVDVERRFKALQSSSPVRLKLIHSIEGDYESMLHEHFKEKREHGEWFKVDVIMLALIQTIKRDGPMKILGEPSGYSKRGENSLWSIRERVVRETLDANGRNISKAARTLGMHRRTVQRILRQSARRANVG